MTSNTKKIQNLLLKKGIPDNIPNNILDFVKDLNVTIINKYENIDENFTKFNLKIKKGNKEVTLNLKISRDFLLTYSLGYNGKEEKLVTRNLDQIKNSIKEIFLR